MTASMLERCIHLGYFDPANGHVPNPGMGIQAYVFSDHMHYGFSGDEWLATERSNPNRPIDRRVFDEMLALPYVDNLYFRTDWNRVQNSPGQLSLPDEWDWMMEAVETHGKRWSFRIMNASRHTAGAHSIPDFLIDRLQMDSYANDYDFGPARRYYPRYTDEYLDRWAELIHLFADRYDDHPLLEFVDISGYGIWGEGHHYGFHEPGTSFRNHHPDNANQAVKRLIDDHLDAFTKTPLAMTLHFLDYEAGVAALEDPAIWPRRDSFQPFTSTIEFRAMADRVPGRAAIWEAIVPGFGNERAPLFYSDRLPQRYLDFTAHYAAVGFNPWDVILAHRDRVDVYEALAERIGYRLRPALIWRRITEHDSHELVVSLVNDGSADVSGTLTLTARFPSGEEVPLLLPRGRPQVGDRTLYTLPMPRSAWGLGSNQSVELRLALALRGKSLPVRWAVRQRLSDPYRIVLPLRMPADGDPFTIPATPYDPSL